jgi:hypothetical protein
VATKMKTLTYQLSNLKFVEEGWTLQRPPDFEMSSDEDSDNEEHILVPRDLASSTIKVIKTWSYHLCNMFCLLTEIRKTINPKIL